MHTLAIRSDKTRIPNARVHKGWHTCWVLIVGEGPHEDLAKCPTKIGALGVRRRQREDKEVRAGGGSPRLLATTARERG